MTQLYHASPVQGLKQLDPRPGTHQQAWVYAVRDRAMAAPFLAQGGGGDFACGIGRDAETGLPYLCERFERAFDRVFAGKAGSLYTLDGGGFVPGQTPWNEEFVSEQAVVPLEEKRVTYAWVYLQDLARQRRILIARYPEKIAGIPEDDEDIVQKAAEWMGTFGEEVLVALKRDHPQLVARVQARLKCKETFR